jgi:endonuclease YncB( thermonuclease family)
MPLVVDVALAVALLGALWFVAQRIEAPRTVRLADRAMVHDGDTLSLAGERIRLRGLDAPELSQTCLRAGADYACGRSARDALAALIGQGQTTCEGWRRDRYGRLLGDCRAGGTALNPALVRQGRAVAYGDFGAEERAARAEGVGLWAGEFERPGDWRARQGSATETEPGVIALALDWLMGLRWRP